MSQSQQERIAAIDGASIPELRDMLDGADPRDRADAACALGDRLRARELESLDAPLRERLAALLRDSEQAVRFEAAVALAEAHDPRATDVLLHALGKRAVRLDAIRALGTLGDKRAVEPLLQLSRRLLLPWADKLQAAAALCALGDARGAKILAERTHSRRRAERAAAIHFVGEARHPDALELLSKVLATVGDPLVDVAVRALGWLGDPAARAVLEAAQAAATGDLAEDIREALERLPRAPEVADSGCDGDHET